MVVWHHRAEPPKEMEVKRRRRGLGPVMHLPPDPVAEPLASHHTVLWNMAQFKPHVLEEFPEWKKRVEGATQDITRRYIGLFRVLRTHEMSKVFHRAGVTFDSKKRETVTGAFGVYSREVTLRNVPVSYTHLTLPTM